MKTIKRYRQMWLVLPIVFCLGVIVYGGINYINNLRENLTGQAIQNVLTVTHQQQQSFDNFIAADRERLHSFADFFSKYEDIGPEDAQEMLTLFDDVKAVMAVSCLDERWLATSADYNYRYMDDETWETYRAFEGSGVRSSYESIFSQTQMFGYYETFNFSSGHKGIIQLSYEVDKFTETFSLSFYNGQGLSYVVDPDGDILLRSAGGEIQYENIFEIISTRVDQADIDLFAQSMSSREPGYLTFEGQRGTYIYVYVPIQAVDDWFLVSVVRMEAITEEANNILMDSQQALMLLTVLLVVCVVFGAAIWATNRALSKRDNKIGYQAALIDIFSTYLSRNTDNVFMLFDVESFKMDYISPNVERVLGVTMDQMMDDVRSFQPVQPAEGEGDRAERLCALEPGTEAEDIYLEWVNPQTQEPLCLLESAYCTLVQGCKKLVLYLSNRTQERRTQDHLTEALRMAKAANEAKSAFLGSVSHDIRTPMNAIIGFTTLLKGETENPAKVQEYAGRIETASQHLLSLINDVLDINKIESGSASLNLVEMNLTEVIDEINAIILPQAKSKEQTFDILVSPLTHEFLKGDKLRINQILINLLSNAVKYTPAGGKIEMQVEELPQKMQKHSHVRFTVSDNGIGMSEDYLKVIFDPFTREETEATYEIQGTGLGMAIAKSLVDLMGGSIKVESKPGEGSTFTVELELAIQEHEGDSGFSDDCGPHQIPTADDDVVRGMHILVVDDIEINRMILTSILDTLGATCDSACNGQEAVEQFEKSRPGEYDLILMDIQMPVLNGYGATRAIRASEHPSARTVPIIAMTANAFVEDVRNALESGMDAHISKPIQVDNMKVKIRQVLDSRLKQPEEPGKAGNAGL